MGREILQKLTGNIILKLTALAIAFVIWVAVTNNDDPVRSIIISNVAINIINEDSIGDIGKVAEPQGSGTVSVKVTERRSVLSRLTRSDFYVEADLENLNEMGTVPLTVSCSNNAITWDEMSISPSSLKVTVEEKVEQAFAVSVTTAGTVASGRAVGTTQVLDGKNILIAGPSSLVGIINQVTAPVSVTGLNSDSTVISTLRVTDRNGSEFTDAQMRRLEFKDASGALLDNHQVAVFVELWYVRNEMPLKVNTTGTPAEGYQISGISTIPQSVTVIGTYTGLRELGGNVTVLDPVDVTGHDGDFTAEVDLTSTFAAYPEVRLPADADPVVSVEIQMEKVEDTTYVIPLGSMQLNNKPENMRLVFTPADEISIRVHPVSEDAGELYPEDIKAVLDLEACKEEGNYEIPVEITLPDGFELSAPVSVMVSASISAQSGGEPETENQVTEKETNRETTAGVFGTTYIVDDKSHQVENDAEDKLIGEDEEDGGYERENEGAVFLAIADEP